VPKEQCSEVWVVTDVPDGRTLLALAGPSTRDVAGPVEVARVPWDESLAEEAEALGGRYLDSADGTGCLRPLEDRVT